MIPLSKIKATKFLDIWLHFMELSLKKKIFKKKHTSVTNLRNCCSHLVTISLNMNWTSAGLKKVWHGWKKNRNKIIPETCHFKHETVQHMYYIYIHTNEVNHKTTCTYILTVFRIHHEKLQLTAINSPACTCRQNIKVICSKRILHNISWHFSKGSSVITFLVQYYHF